MWKRKKVIFSVLAGVIVLAASLVGGMAFAADDVVGDSEASRAAMLGRVAEIYEENTGTVLDAEQLQAALQQAGDEMRDAAMQERLDALVTEGTITQEEANEYSTWWDAKPDTLPMMEPRGSSGRVYRGHMMPGMFPGQ